VDYQKLLHDIALINASTQVAALRAINQILTIRNWLMGAYLIEYEQNGLDRAAYGAQVLERLAQDLKQQGIKGLAVSNLRSFRQFALTYPQLAQPHIFSKIISLTPLLPSEIRQTLSGEFKSGEFNPNEPRSTEEYIASVTPADFPSLQARAQENPPFDWQTADYYQQLFQALAWSHFLELSRVDDRLKRSFYELEAVKSRWSIRELKRQMSNLLYERVGLSKDRSSVLALAEQGKLLDTPESIVRDPYFLEFLGLKEEVRYSETELENALLDHLQEFMQELGRDFCFVERQFRITVDNEHHHLDLLFYHRSLQCLIAIDLKLGKFRHDFAGQMNFYLNYLKANVAYPHENPPVGILLCAERDAETVSYATAGMDNQMFVSRYMIALPSEEKLKQWLKQEQERLG
jgi:predicted nuclease of restriction endonuclease-like (RecB) superfamily